MRERAYSTTTATQARSRMFMFLNPNASELQTNQATKGKETHH